MVIVNVNNLGSVSTLNYFRFGATNACAEDINNQGIRDRAFFYFRLKNYFS
jgi:hypothetical protein